MPNLSIAAGYSASTFEAPSADDPGGDLESYIIGVDWNPVDNLIVRVNYRHQNWDKEDLNPKVDEIRVRVRRTF